jgi:hypothetical protein
MTNESQCGSCGQLEVHHQDALVENATNYVMAKSLLASSPADYAKALDQILLEWRTHALPECDPLSIS